MTTTLTFLGAAGTVTGSKYLVRSGDIKILVDVGLFQGDRRWREKNWDEPPIDLSTINAVLITHAHIDHIGMLPRYYKLGLKCPVFLTTASKAVAELLLPDSGRLQEEEAQYRSERGKSRHHPPLPLYTEDDARRSLTLLREVPFHTDFEVIPGVYAKWTRMGHIIGAGAIKLSIGGKVIQFSGDIGRYNVPILSDPEPVEFPDLLLIESTYGNRTHAIEDPKVSLASVITRTAKRGGIVIIPSFAVGRAQHLLYYLRELKEENQIPDIPVIIDSPMASDATALYSKFTADYDEEARKLLLSKRAPFFLPKLHFVKDRSESIKLNSIDSPMVLISASGMLSGGRILHHLKNRISDPRNTILFVGFQPPGSRGDWIKSGAKSLRLFGDEVPIRSEIEELSMLSAHADEGELLRWCKDGKGRPGRVSVVHGEREAALHFAARLNKDLDWRAEVATYQEELTIT